MIEEKYSSNLRNPLLKYMYQLETDDVDAENHLENSEKYFFVTLVNECVPNFGLTMKNQHSGKSFCHFMVLFYPK